jgi:hypothetical protein
MFCEGKESNRTDSKDRPPVFFNITEVSPTSEVTITFSEDLFSADEFEKIKLNKTLFDDFRKAIIDVTYESTLSEEVRPELVDWVVLNFTNKELILGLNFTNILFVSS